MTLQVLADTEKTLYEKVVELYRQPQSDKTDEALQEISLSYKKIHQTYAEMSFVDDEALKRGLFLQWYALSEPNYLIGIADLDENAENKIIQSLNDRIETGNVDDELIWMLNYYANWDWIFERLTSFKGFNSKILNEQNDSLPDKIDRAAMAQRGQMGEYWNSLTQFSKA